MVIWYSLLELASVCGKLRMGVNEEKNYGEILKGKTLRIYVRLVESGHPWTARELQRDLGLSTPSLSLYHLNKLVEYSLVEVNQDGLYTVSKIVRVGTLRHFIKFGRQLIPRYLFYDTFFVSVLVTSLIFFEFTYHPIDILFLLVLIIAIAVFTWESIWFLRHGFE